MWWWEDSLLTYSAFLRDWERPTISVWVGKIVIRESALFTFNCIYHLTAQSSMHESASTEALYFLFLAFYTSLCIFCTINLKVPYIPWFRIDLSVLRNRQKEEGENSSRAGPPLPLSHRTQCCWRKTLFVWRDFSPLFLFWGRDGAFRPFTHRGCFHSHTGTGAGS